MTDCGLPGIEAIPYGVHMCHSLVIRDYSEWYAESDTIKGNEIVDAWIGEEQAALAKGYSGLRITGNVTFLTPDNWNLFMEYEAQLNTALRGRRIVIPCSYQLGQCGSVEVVDVVHRMAALSGSRFSKKLRTRSPR